MYVGYMRNQLKPKKFAKLLARTTKSYGIDFVHCLPEDVDFDKKVINGQVLVGNKWVSKEVPIPPFIDLSSYCFRHKKVINFLKEHSTLSIDRRLGSKDVVNKKIIEDGEFSHLIIPSKTVEDFETFFSFLEENNEIIIKPINGSRGKGIYKLSITENGYLLIFDNKEEVLSKEELYDFFEKINYDRFLFQKFIHSSTKGGDPFDCRIRLEKNGKGLWEVAIYLVRIGSGNKVVSNVSSGGSASKLTPFLKANYGEMATLRIKTAIKEVAEFLPPKLEKMFDTRLTALGLDIGIEKDGTIYLFETNTTPGPEFALGEVALLKAEHYHYMLNKSSLSHRAL
ncbi:YheC/YheD family protein [Salipaludibacillus daqingensis]|uniref:YheC/YheD family protein n=1 Tax=Salipaludibacillus daqingensis TaxID=3041001 RepID=UPI002476BC2D|nr:YheC/YheD family protein [Salipaludibacillus daqingensis]